MPSDFKRVKEIFLKAVEQTDPEGREECLRQACEGNAELHRRVQALLRRHEQAGSLLDRPAFEPPPHRVAHPSQIADPNPAHEAVGARIGPYKLLQRIGEGGMGAVWMAEQREPVRRLVALKVVRGDLDRAQGVARFEAERQALALMDHPNIARVLDAGTTADNRPYFVMELVKGTLVTEYCDQHRLTTRQRLELFVPICQALQHAHQKGIIHRDIKPSNVLVAPYDGRPVVKVIDFGVAKAVGPRLTERTLFTEFGTVVGTLEYMSPEQAELNNQDIDTRSDVYSLGVLLYELLTGTTPLTAERLEKTAFLELLRAIREEDPPRPSTRLSDSQASLSSISARRKTEPAKLRKLLLGELDWIVMKALEKNRGRRYQTANALARDVERYLNDETVEARPPSPGYRIGKILRRNKGPAIAAAGILTALVLGLVGTLIFAVGEAEQRRQATRNALLAEAEKTAALYQAYWAHLAAAGAALQNDDVVDAAQQLRRAPEGFRDWEWQHLHTRLDDSTTVLQANAGESQFLIRDSKGIRIASHTPDRVRISDLQGHDLWIRSFGTELDLVNCSPIQTPHGLRLVGNPARKLTLDPASPRLPDPARRMFNLLDDQGRLIYELKGPGESTVHLAVASPDGSRLVVCWKDRERCVFAIYDPDSGKVRSTSTQNMGVTWAVAFSPDGTRIATAGEDGLIRLWDTSNGTMIVQCQGHSRKVLGVAFRPDGERLVSTSADGTVRQWDAVTGREIELPYERRAGEVLTAAYSPDGLWIASVSTDRTIRVWNAASRQDVAILRGHTGEVSDLAFIDDGRRLVSVSHSGGVGTMQDATVRLWEVGLQGGESVLRGHSSYVYPVSYSPDGRWIASGAWDHTIRLWDAATGEACATLPQPGVVWALAFDSGGNWLVCGGDYGGELLLWDVATGQLRSRLPAPGNRVRSVAVHPDGTQVAVGYIDANAKLSMSVFDMATGREIGSGAGTPFVFSPDGKWIAGRGRDAGEKNVVLWDARTIQPVVALQGHTELIHAVAFSRDGRRLVSGSSDRTVRLWDAESGQCLRVFEANTDIVFSAVFHPDGKRMASAGRDGTIWLWDLATGQKVARLDGHANYVYSLAFSPDGRSLVSGSGDSTVRVWDTVPLAERYEARRQAESLRPDAERLLDRMTEETKDPAKIVAALRSDRQLSEPLREATLRAVVTRYSKRPMLNSSKL